MNFSDEAVYMADPVVAWLSGELYCPVSPPFIRRLATDFMQQCLSTENSDDTNLFTPLLRVWAKIQLRDSSWNDALAVARNVSISFCSGIPPWLDTPFLSSLLPQDS